MPSKTSKRLVKRKHSTRKPAGFDKLPAKQPPDTSRIPWFPAVKTGTNA